MKYNIIFLQSGGQQVGDELQPACSIMCLAGLHGPMLIWWKAVFWVNVLAETVYPQLYNKCVTAHHSQLRYSTTS